MQAELTNSAIIQFLKLKYQGAGFIDSLKIKYRSLICPFTELIAMVQPGEKVGDVGCGSGQFLLLVSQFARPSAVYGIEISKTLISNAQSLFSTVSNCDHSFEEYNGTVFPERLSELDLIFLIDVFHHVPKNNQERFIYDLAKSMKVGSRLVFKDINAASPLVYINKMHDLIFAGEIGNETSFEMAKSLLTKNGLRIIQQEKRTMYVYPHYTIVAEK